MSAGAIAHIAVAPMTSVSAASGAHSSTGGTHSASHRVAQLSQGLDKFSTAEVLAALMKHHSHAHQASHASHAGSIASASTSLAQMSHKAGHASHAACGSHHAASTAAVGSHLNIRG